jgi:enoyl-CoA hydratase
MNLIQVSKESGITTVTMSRGKVNAINETFVDELGAVFNELAADADTKAVILTGAGNSAPCARKCSFFQNLLSVQLTGMQRRAGAYLRLHATSAL